MKVKRWQVYVAGYAAIAYGFSFAWLWRHCGAAGIVTGLGVAVCSYVPFWVAAWRRRVFMRRLLAE